MSGYGIAERHLVVEGGAIASKIERSNQSRGDVEAIGNS